MLFNDDIKDQSSHVDLLVVLLVEIDSHLQFQNDDSENDEIDRPGCNGQYNFVLIKALDGAPDLIRMCVLFY